MNSDTYLIAVTTFLKSPKLSLILKFKGIMLALLLIPGFVGTAYAHTVDSVGPYRIEIGWMTEPVVSNETNAIELSISPMIPGIELEEQIFKDGIAGLEDTIKIELLSKDEQIILPLVADHNVPGKYFAFVNPTAPGFYQANILGNIVDTPISLSMHPPKVEERAYIEFPKPADYTVTQIIDGHTALIEEIHDLKEEVEALQHATEQLQVGYVGAGLGVAGIAVAAVALVRSKR